MAILSETFPKLEFSTKLYWKLLGDLKDQDFEQAIVSVIQELEELYPTSNLIAILRHRARDLAIQRLGKLASDTRKLTDETSAPPPPEWKEVKKKLGIR